MPLAPYVVEQFTLDIAGVRTPPATDLQRVRNAEDLVSVSAMNFIAVNQSGEEPSVRDTLSSFETTDHAAVFPETGSRFVDGLSRYKAQLLKRVRPPRRFGVVGHDPGTENSMILGWGLDYGDGEIVIGSTQDDRRWTLTAPEDIRRYFPDAPKDGLELIWIDGPTAQ